MLHMPDNLSLMGSGTKTFPAALTISGNLSVASGAVADLATFTSTAIHFTLGGPGAIGGTGISAGKFRFCCNL